MLPRGAREIRTCWGFDPASGRAQPRARRADHSAETLGGGPGERGRARAGDAGPRRRRAARVRAGRVHRQAPRRGRAGLPAPRPRGAQAARHQAPRGAAGRRGARGRRRAPAGLHPGRAACPALRWRPLPHVCSRAECCETRRGIRDLSDLSTVWVCLHTWSELPVRAFFFLVFVLFLSIIKHRAALDARAHKAHACLHLKPPVGLEPAHIEHW